MNPQEPPQRSRKTPMSSAAECRPLRPNHAAMSTQGMPESAWKTKTACFRRGRWLVKCEPKAPGRYVMSVQIAGSAPRTVLEAPRCERKTGTMATTEMSARETPQNSSTQRAHATFFQWRSSGRVMAAETSSLEYGEQRGHGVMRAIPEPHRVRETTTAPTAIMSAAYPNPSIGFASHSAQTTRLETRSPAPFTIPSTPNAVPRVSGEE